MRETMQVIRSLSVSNAFVVLAVLFILAFTGTRTPVSAGQAEYVIVISVDGGGSGYIQNLIDLNLLPNFRRFQTEGTWTNNARNDYDYTITLPNHTTMVTGLGVLGLDSNGHLWTGNVDPSINPTDVNYSVQNNKGSYVFSVFDVAHDNEMRTALYTTKTKFSLFDHSYNNGNGAQDATGPDNGTNKIDVYVYNASSDALTASFATAMGSNPYNYALIHFTDGDTYGHASGWGSTAYNDALIAVDGYIGTIFSLVTSNPLLQGKTAIILTADHGGSGTTHSANNDSLNYTIPFYVWGPDSDAGTNLYTLNQGSRLNPDVGRPSYADIIQPIRNGDSANLALNMLGLGAIPGSTINESQDLKISSNLPVPGICGTANGQALFVSPPANELCASGISSIVTGTGPWVWKCVGQYLGPNVNCSASPVYHSVNVTMTGSGVGTVTSSPAGVSCTTGSTADCSSLFSNGSSVTLTAASDWKSIFTGWAVGCSGIEPCTISVNADVSVTAMFTKNYQIKMANALTTYASLQEAYNGATDGETLLLQVYSFPETLYFNKTIRVIIRGGKDSDYSNTLGFSTVQGSIFIQQGTVEINEVIIR